MTGVSQDALKAAMQSLVQAEQLYREKRYQEALAMLQQAESGGAPAMRVAQLRNQINRDYQKWAEAEAERQRLAADQEARTAQIWAIDTDAPAGKTYRYRARVVMFNIYTHPDVDRSQLKNQADGAKLALVGEWSEASPPIRIASANYWFLASANVDVGAATVNLFRFQQGQWFKEILPVGLGDPIGDVKQKDAGGGNRVDVDFRTGRVVVDVGTDSATLAEAETSGGKPIRPTTVSSAMLVAMDSDGTLEQRWSVKDRNSLLQKELEYKVKLGAGVLAGVGAPTASGVPAR